MSVDDIVLGVNRQLDPHLILSSTDTTSSSSRSLRSPSTSSKIIANQIQLPAQRTVSAPEQQYQTRITYGDTPTRSSPDVPSSRQRSETPTTSTRTNRSGSLKPSDRSAQNEDRLSNSSESILGAIFYDRSINPKYVTDDSDSHIYPRLSRRPNSQPATNMNRDNTPSIEDIYSDLPVDEKSVEEIKSMYENEDLVISEHDEVEDIPATPILCCPPGNGGGDDFNNSGECPCSLDCLLNKSIGPWGAWQMRISILASLLKFPIAWFQLGIVFLAPATDFWCAKPPSGTIPTIDLLSPEEWKSMVYCNGTGQHKTCLLHGSCYMQDPRAPITDPPVPCLWGYEFDTSVHHSTIITEWEMVCSRAKMIDLSQAVLMFGILLGTVILGITSDRVGRKPVLVTCLFVQTIAGVLSSLSPSYSLFLLTRFIMAFANAGTMVCSFVMCMEVVGGKWRTIVPVLYQIPFGIGNTVMALVAYFIRDWRAFQLTLSLLSAFYWTYWWFMPESPRWLLATGRKERATQLLKDIARENGKTEGEIKRAMRCVPTIIPICGSSTKLSMKDLFNTHVILMKTCVLCVHWFCAGISFYGFSQYMGQITNHLYAMVAIGGLISLPGTILCCYIIQRFGRRETIAGAHMFTAACYLGILVVPQGKHFADWPRVMFAAFGVVGLSVSTPALYLFSGELFPTVLRNAGMGVVMMCSRVGSMIAPFVTSLSTVSNWLPLFILSICVFLEALLVIPLPETKDCALPDTVADAEAFTSNNTNLPKCFNIFTIHEKK